MKKDSRKQLGVWGESVAAHYLEAQGFDILVRNWRCALGEIDIVAQTGETVRFIEVKTRRGRQMGHPEEGLTAEKANRLKQLAQHYVAKHALDVDWQIDLVAVELDRGGKLIRCEHIPHAVLGW